MITCPACEWRVRLIRPGIARCDTQCGFWATLQDNGRWLFYLPSYAVPTSDWVDCPTCEGSGQIECAGLGCSYDDHAGPCHNCHSLGVVRGTLDHPTTQPPLETP